MAEFVFERGRMTVITLRVPSNVWDAWEYRHNDFGKAVHALRESAIEIMSAGSVRLEPGPIRDDPFFRG